ncbi:RNA ligase family protein [Bosea sp. RCC_152_1]|uniref:RNA ligase family protein n=1 Tax=Bosea sp. RCC_152_1 TaxID=3239228 RepID=UPI003523DE74
MSIFSAYPKTPRISKAFWCIITEKLDGTNAQIIIENGQIVGVGSRSRLITPGKLTDNYGFAGWVEQNASELVKLGDGRHFGEWYGNGIQRGYGLDHKRFALFDAMRWSGRNVPPEEFPNCVEVVPVIYRGEYSPAKVTEAMELLRYGGSYAAEGFMNPEGIIVEMNGQRAKHTFEHVDGKWLAA